MKGFLKWIFAALVVFGIFGGCDRRKVISDKNLREILTEIYISNAYVSMPNTSVSRVALDSLDMYQPIFKKYGYTVEDFKYTIENFSRRKSSRLSDVVNDVINRLNSEYATYEARVAMLDSIDAMAYRMTERVVYTDSLIRVRKIADTAKLRIMLPVEPGVYTVSYAYETDSLELNRNLRTNYIVFDTLGRRRQAATQSIRLNRRDHDEKSITIEGKDTQLMIVLGNYQKGMKTPSLRIDSLEIKYHPERAVALDTLLRRLLDYRFMLDGEEFSTLPKDSCALATDAPWAIERCDSLP